ncbi:ribose-phosphate diphosphokinase [Polymorphum gilvum]|uniref:ribose-phosphate diphosphokinase n=1 Tax=Polymorphum gilvum (strain LMG 25793 / CGMCC 1.9160 / SL003B-26A1) TaxID=991905 RepID=F2IYS7_POLGS|nr:ribose-phosphate diphosphokinase [Polymorphum gilvum]ADZ69524.1 Ribose-phosphate pyrophosphokinase family protein [Polymorphum gilvum SL003B-26A1]
MLFFALHGSDDLGRAMAAAGGFAVAEHEEREFEGGEHKARPLVGVRGADVYVLHGLQGRPGASANDRLCRLLFFIAACKENGAARVTALVPYLAYSRKDRQTKPRDPVTTAYVARLFEAVGTDQVVTLDVHSITAFQNAFRCRTVHLDTRALFADRLAPHVVAGPVAIVSPDGGGIKRAQLLKEALEARTGQQVDFGFMEKRRSAGVVSGALFAGDIEGRSAFIVDDLIASGGTLLRAAKACRAHGAAAVHAVATHGLFEEPALPLLSDPALDGMIVTDSAAPFAVAPERFAGKLEVLSVAPLLAGAVARLAGGGSIEALLQP